MRKFGGARSGTMTTSSVVVAFRMVASTWPKVTRFCAIDSGENASIMTRKATAVACLLFVTSLVAAQDPIPPPLRAMADTELEFAAAARVKGIRDSFLEFFADDAIAFEPQPVKAKDRLSSRPSQPFAVNELTWEPRTGDVAASG